MAEDLRKARLLSQGIQKEPRVLTPWQMESLQTVLASNVSFKITRHHVEHTTVGLHPGEF